MPSAWAAPRSGATAGSARRLDYTLEGGNAEPQGSGGRPWAPASAGVTRVRTGRAMSDTGKYLLDERRLPKGWYNIVADLPPPPEPVPAPGTFQTVRPADRA